jgi:RNA polymerase subunit RPABC4/transcription elongation factor Spt4
MNPCQNCGKLNTPETNFCRFCGTRFQMQAPMPENPYDFAAPRPYAWKTDEYQTHNEPRPTAHISAGRPATQHIDHQVPQPIAFGGPHFLAHPFRCPKCMSSIAPRQERRVSTAGWITLAVLVVFFFPLFWIGLLIKEDVQVCTQCGTKVPQR